MSSSHFISVCVPLLSRLLEWFFNKVQQCFKLTPHTHTHGRQKICSNEIQHIYAFTVTVTNAKRSQAKENA